MGVKRYFKSLGTSLLFAVGALIIGWIMVSISNKNFPEKYVAKTFPNAEVLSYDISEGALFDTGYMYYELRDNETGMVFKQKFVESGLFGKIVPYDDAEGYKTRRANWNAEEENIAAAEGCLSAEHFIIRNPLNVSGIVIFAKNESAENIDLLMRTLNESILNQQRGVNVYTQYTIISCGERFYWQMKSFDFDNMYTDTACQCSFTDIAEKADIDYEAIKHTDIAELDYAVYNADSSVSYDGKAPSDFDETVVCIIGECNTLGNQHMYVYGVNY